MTQESGIRRENFYRSPLKGIGESFPACNVAWELGRERGKGHEMTEKIDEKQSGTTAKALNRVVVRQHFLVTSSRAVG